MESRRWSSHDHPHRRPSSADDQRRSHRRARTPLFLLSEDQMPTYACSAATGRLTPTQRVEIVQSITAIHHEETGAPRYFVQVIFYDIAYANHYIAGQLAPAGQMWIRGDIRMVEARSRRAGCFLGSCRK